VIKDDIATVLADRAASYWLKNAITTALTRDPVDAANDAEKLLLLLKDLADGINDAMGNIKRPPSLQLVKRHEMD
jgi:hypothetical protein